MRFDWWTLILQTVNFAVLAWLLHRFLYKPVLRMVDTRRAEVQKRYADAEQAQAEATARLAAIDSERSGISAERAAALKAAATQAGEMAAARRTEAEREAAAVLERARKAVADERREAQAEIRDSALGLGVEVACRLLAEVPIDVRAGVWLERIEQHLKGLTDRERSELCTELDQGEMLRVLTVTALPPNVADDWRTRLEHALGTDVSVGFEADPGLVAGAELHFPNVILRFSWRSALETIKAEIGGRVDAG